MYILIEKIKDLIFCYKCEIHIIPKMEISLKYDFFKIYIFHISMCGKLIIPKYNIQINKNKII